MEVLPCETRMHWQHCPRESTLVRRAFLSLSHERLLTPATHTGMFVSESKFRSDPASFIQPIQTRNRQALEDLITKPEVEKALLVRLAAKAKVYGQDLNSSMPEHAKIDAEVPVQLYRDFVIPLTKVVEVDYLLKRCVVSPFLSPSPSSSRLHLPGSTGSARRTLKRLGRKKRDDVLCRHSAIVCA